MYFFFPSITEPWPPLGRGFLYLKNNVIANQCVKWCANPPDIQS